MSTSLESPVAPDPVVAYAVLTVGIPALVITFVALVLNWGR